MAKARDLVREFRESWKKARARIETATIEEVRPYLTMASKHELVRALDAFGVLAESLSKTPKGLDAKSDSVYRYANTLFRSRLRSMTASCDQITQGDLAGIKGLWAAVLYSQTSLAILMRSKAGARDDVLARLAEQEASALAEHAALTESVASLTASVSELSAQVVDSSSTLTDATQHSNSKVESLETWIDETRSELESSIQALVSSATDAEGGASAAAASTADLQKSAQAAQEAAEAASERADSLATTLETAHKEAARALATLDEHNEKLANLADSESKAQSAREGSHEEWRREFQTQAEDMVKAHEAEFRAKADKIESLVSGATGVALGESFNTQANRSKVMVWVYLGAFVAAIVALVTAQVLLTNVKFERWEEGLLMRVLIGVSLGWLALFLQRAHTTRTRIAEDYAFKAARAITYEGYRRRADEVDETGDISVQLLESMLAVISTNPVAAADAAKPDVAPVQEIAEKLAETLKDLKKLAPGLTAAQVASLRVLLKEGADTAE